MNCEKCFHKDVCHRYLTEPRMELDLTGCTYFIGISDNFNANNSDIISYILGYLSGCEDAAKKFNKLNSFQFENKENNKE